jgi:hypothetical protein
MATALTPKDFVEALKTWSVLDVVEAIKAIEAGTDHHGLVSGAGPGCRSFVMSVGSPGSGGALVA